MSKRQTFVNAAVGFLGYKEADGSYKEIIQLYNSISPLPVSYELKLSDEWCAGFVSAVAQKVGMTDIVFPECGCERMIELYKKAGRWQEKDDHSPSPGDIIFYDWQDSGSGDNKGHSDHVGIVVSRNNTTLKIIEGNYSNKVAYRNLKVNGKYIRGYGLPDFGEDDVVAVETSTKATASPAKTAAVKTISLPLKQLSRGSTGAQVKAMQILLIGKGYSCGTAGADGDFGAGTYSALTRFQQVAGLEVDGICGAVTWAALLGV